MSFLKQITLGLLLISQLTWSFQNFGNSVFCLEGNGRIAIQQSINGLCIDSQSQPQFNHAKGNYPPGDLHIHSSCRDISIGNSFLSVDKAELADFTNSGSIAPARLQIFNFETSSNHGFSRYNLGIDNHFSYPVYKNTIVLRV